MKSTMKAVLLSVLISCAIAPQTLAQQIPKTAISAKPNSSKTAQKKTAPTKSWSRWNAARLNAFYCHPIQI